MMSFSFLRRSVPAFALGLVLMMASAVTAAPVTITVTIQNLAPVNGNFLTPLWVGFHNGGFDIYNPGAPVTPGVERVAEDGLTAAISSEFAASGAGVVQGTIMGPVMPEIAPGQTASMAFIVDGSLTSSRYFSYATMIIPSNDTFIANDNPFAFPVFDSAGNFLGADFIVLGSQVLDAGTEVNDEIPAHTAFFGQMMPNTGVTENGVVGLHPGFLPPGSGGILDDPRFMSADFRAPGYQIARITVTQGTEPIPEPATIVLLGTGLAGVAAGVRQRRIGKKDAAVKKK